MNVPLQKEEQAFSAILGRYDRALVHLHECGISPHPASRFLSYRRELSSHTESDYSSLHKLERLAFVLREIDEMSAIVDGLSQPPKAKEIEALKAITSGAFHPDDETADQNARDLQYELWLMSRFRVNGVLADLVEPDLSVYWRGRSYAVAAKRPRNWSGVDRCIRSALSQLKPYPEGGIVAVSIDSLLRPRGKVADAISRSDFAEAMDELFIEALQRFLSAAISKRAANRNAVAFLITGALPAFIRDETGKNGCCCLETRCELISVEGDPRSAGLEGLREKLSSYYRPPDILA